MITLSMHDLRSLLYFFCFGAVGAAILAVFFGGLLSLVAPRSGPLRADPVLPAQALEAFAVLPARHDDTAGDSSPAAPADKVAAPPALSNRKVLPLLATVTVTRLVTPGRNSHVKKGTVRRHHREETAKRWAAVWRPDASVGPNPGGGFYVGPNINVGRINP